MDGTRLSEHHDVALMLLVGRSLPDGMPWSMDQDRAIIAQERLLWASLTEEERAQEQRFMADLWGRRGANRKVPVNPSWGLWTQGLPSDMPVPDSAFGVPQQGFRPASKGVDDAPAHLVWVYKWLWSVGFQPVHADAKGFSLTIPVHRLVQEAERLTTLLVRTFPKLSIQPFGSDGGVQIRSVYDPISGQASLEVVGLDDSSSS